MLQFCNVAISAESKSTKTKAQPKAQSKSTSKTKATDSKTTESKDNTKDSKAKSTKTTESKTDSNNTKSNNTTQDSNNTESSQNTQKSSSVKKKKKPYATKDSDLIFLGYIRKPMNATIALDRVNEKAVIFGYNDKKNFIEFTPKADNIYCVEAYFKTHAAQTLFPVISVMARVAILPYFELVDKQNCLQRADEFYANYEKAYQEYNDNAPVFKDKFMKRVQKIRKKSSDDSNDIESSQEEE